MDLQLAFAKQSVCAGPWLKSAKAIVNFGCRALEVDATVVFDENRRESGLRIILRAGARLAALKFAEGFKHQVGAYGREFWSERLGGIVGGDGEFFLQQNVAGVQAGVDFHGGDAGDGFSARDCPLDG